MRCTARQGQHKRSRQIPFLAGKIQSCRRGRTGPVRQRNGISE
nr:MAG TPA: hypothetical protein [Caudoviricetes sp.]